MATHSSILAWRICMNRGAWWATVYVIAESDTTVCSHIHTHKQLEVAWALGSYQNKLKSTLACSSGLTHTHTHTHTHCWKLHGLWALIRISSNQHLLVPLASVTNDPGRGVCSTWDEKWSNTSKPHSLLYVNQSSIKRFWKTVLTYLDQIIVLPLKR